MKRHLMHAEGGFVLVLTLWILAAIAIAATYFAERVQTSLRLAASRQDLAESQMKLSDGRAELLFRLGVSPLQLNGLGEPANLIRLDGRLYVDAGGLVSVQDAGGLIYLNSLPDEILSAYLGTFGVPQDRRATLVDTLRDYTDADSLRRLNGAEAPQYEAAGKPGLPTNQPLRTPLELRQVLGWSEQPELWGHPGVLDSSTADGRAGINPNTAPKQVLMALQGVTAELADLIIARRELEPVDAAWLDRSLGTTYSIAVPSVIQPFPASTVRITQWAPGLVWGHRYNVELTPVGTTAPWRITAFHRLERGPQTQPAAPSASILPTPAHASDPPPLPPRPAFAASAPSLLAN
jgi:DNA uptake protein ComE-like DNA-binding protein